MGGGGCALLGEVVASRGGRLSEDVSFKGGSTLLSKDGEDVPFLVRTLLSGEDVLCLGEDVSFY